MKKPFVLCILDGVGLREEENGNAFKLAKKPSIDYLFENYPNSTLEASGEFVGLPKGQMGNSEVGHSNIGSGRIIYQPLEFITKDIQENTFFKNKNILNIMNHVKKNKSKLHIFGLLSDGGIHSHISHLFGLIDMCKKQNVGKVYLHLFTDGRDTDKRCAMKYFDLLNKKIDELNIGIIATIHGRYYAMDRDNNYDRLKKSYDAIVYGEGNQFNNYKEAINSNYEKNIDDEFIEPSIIDKNGIVESNDGLIVFNFRPDRLRELFSVLTNNKINPFQKKLLKNIKLVTMMPVSKDVICKNAYDIQNVNNTLGEYISRKGLKQLRIAETEKFAHVTYFFDGGKETKFKNCDSILIPSPKVKTYDMCPEMSAYKITDELLEVIDNYDIIILNYANGDMVGHTGNLNASIKAMEVIDACVKKIYNKVSELEGTMMIIADHGNCEYMKDSSGNEVTTHTTSLVPFLITDKTIKISCGKLSDVSPTILDYLNFKIPREMTGTSLIRR